MTTPEQGRVQVIVGDAFDFSDIAFLTIAEVATVMRVSKMTVYRMVRDGTLPAKKVGRSFRLPAQAVREYLAGADVTAN